ncbi:MAG: phosphate ABC transporter ATP-binding protein PstB [Peptococcaceae bacterium]
MLNTGNREDDLPANNISEQEQNIINVTKFNAWYGNKQVLFDVNMGIKKKQISAFIGPSGCGKTTLLRCFNRMNDVIKNFRYEGTICFNNEVISSAEADPLLIRKKVGMVFQQPNPFPMSVYENLRLPIVENSLTADKQKMEEIMIAKLKDVNLYEEIKDRLTRSALKISGGQQQRLCIARALTINPAVILFDEPCSALDPISTQKIENLLLELKAKYTVVIVTHNIEQARRIADQVAFFYQGRVVEQGLARNIFTNPQTELLENYLTGKF